MKNMKTRTHSRFNIKYDMPFFTKYEKVLQISLFEIQA